jgi:hypothetical protein
MIWRIYQPRSGKMILRREANCVLHPIVAGSEIELREFYNDYEAPAYVEKIVRRLLATVPEKYLRGIDAIVLTNQSGRSRKDRRKKVISRKRKVSLSHAFGLYHAAWSGRPPWIELFVDNIVAGFGRFSWMAIVREACFGHVLFHEIGHHVEATIRPEFREKEDVADDWGKKFMANFFRKKYWFLMPIGKPVGRLLRILAKMS